MSEVGYAIANAMALIAILIVGILFMFTDMISFEATVVVILMNMASIMAFE